MSDEVSYSWREPIPDYEIVELVESHGGQGVPGLWDSVDPHSLGWITARDDDGVLVGFVNVDWDGGDHAFLIDTKTRVSWQSRGVGTEVVRQAARDAKAAGCELAPRRLRASLGAAI